MCCKELRQMHVKLFQNYWDFHTEHRSERASFPCPEIKAKATRRPKRSIVPSLIWDVSEVLNVPLSKDFINLLGKHKGTYLRSKSSKSVNLNVARLLYQAAAEAVLRDSSACIQNEEFFWPTTVVLVRWEIMFFASFCYSFIGIRNKIGMYAWYRLPRVRDVRVRYFLYNINAALSMKPSSSGGRTSFLHSNLTSVPNGFFTCQLTWRLTHKIS